MKNIIYGIEWWDDDRKEWRPHRFGGEDLYEMAEALRLIEDAIPWKEFRLAQYTVTEFQHIKSFE